MWFNYGWIFLFVVVGCTQQPTQKNVTSEQSLGMVLWLAEQRANSSEEPVRMLINQHYLRMDQGPSSGDYMIFDRRQQTIYNIVAEDKTIASIKSQAVKINPISPIEWTVTSQPSHALPKTQATQSLQATHHRYALAEDTCYNVVAITGLLDEAVIALREYRQVLAGEWVNTYQATAEEACWAAVNIFTPTMVLQKGFPMREWGSDGYQRFLMKYHLNQLLPQELFELPTGFTELALHD